MAMDDFEHVGEGEVRGERVLVVHLGWIARAREVRWVARAREARWMARGHGRPGRG